MASPTWRCRRTALYLYAASSAPGAVAVFARNPIAGSLTFLQSLDDADADGLANARAVPASADGGHIYVSGSDDVAGGGDDTIAIFRREEVGTLAYLGRVQDGVGGVDGLAGVAGLALSPDGEHLYAAGLARRLDRAFVATTTTKAPTSVSSPSSRSCPTARSRAR